MSEHPTLQVEVFKAVRSTVPPSFLREVLGRAATVSEVQARLPGGNVSIAIRLTRDSELRRLNRAYAGEDAITDVLSFAGADQHLGDVAISWPAVVRQAEQAGHTVQTEAALLAVHGLLHLLGWDHASVDQEREMSRLTVAALKVSGLKPAMRWVWSGYTPVKGLRRSPRA